MDPTQETIHYNLRYKRQFNFKWINEMDKNNNWNETSVGKRKSEQI